MTKDDIIRMAWKTGLVIDGNNSGNDDLVAFANLVAAAEREACADIVDNAYTPDCGGWNALGISRAIRARGAT